MKKYFISLTLVILLVSTGIIFHSLNQKIYSNGFSNKNFFTANKDTGDYKNLIDGYRSKMGEAFIYKGYSYFVIVSNLGEAETDKLISNTLSPAVKCFYNDYFDKKPDDLTTIILFKDDETYRNWAKKLFDDDDLSKFGYYKPDKKVMLMNISTGTGTLVHELTHALVRFDFTDIPAWFNEGLGSLYERSSLQDGIILGYVNWRLPALQEAINDGSYTKLSELIKLDDDVFYGKKSEFNYAQARYFCMYMQETPGNRGGGLLKKFYKIYRDNFEKDKTGLIYIEKLFNKKINDIDADFVSWVKTLKYEG